MFRTDSPFGNDTSSYAESVHSIGYSTMDESTSQVSSLSRPSPKSIYLQRKEYAASINNMMDKFQYRVEHLFTCDLDGRDLRGVADCVERVKLLDGMGRVWGQSMLVEVRGSKLQLTDMETRAELESIALSDISEFKAALDTGALNSLLTVSVKSRKKPTTTVFVFQCEDVRADFIQKDLTRALARWKEDSRSRGPTPEAAPRWSVPDYEDDDVPDPELFVPEEDDERRSLRPSTAEDERPYSETDRKANDLNQLLNGIETFMGNVAAVVAKDAKKKSKKKKGKAMPPPAEFADCFHKIKCAFNLVGELNGKIDNPSAPDFVHSLFSTLAFVDTHSPVGLASTIESPPLTPQSVRLMSAEVSPEEDELWHSLGEAWNIPSSKWQGDNISAYSLESRQSSRKWGNHSQPGSRPGELQPSHMRVKYDFIARNQRELTVTKGEVVELVDPSRQWWRVRNRTREEGYVPNNVLEPLDDNTSQSGDPPALTRRSSPAEVRAWLEDKGFSKITVRCLSVLNGAKLLDMPREELKVVCPEEGGRVFFKLQAVKSSMN